MQTIRGSLNWRNALVGAAKTARRAGQEDAKAMRARPAGTYRGARRNQDRTNARCRALKEERLLMGVSRSELDRMRHARWQLIKVAESRKEFDSALERKAAEYSEQLQAAFRHQHEQFEIEYANKMNAEVA